MESLMNISNQIFEHFLVFDARVMKALGSAGVPVPKTLALCEDSRLVNNFHQSSTLPSGLLFCF